MTSRRLEGFQFGQRRPPLSDTIKRVLDRYPDGQIFKEVIQNADDAGARVVRFYLDRRQHGREGLVHPQLSKYQGPALLAYNDAEFGDEDWEGIQNIQRSHKAEDPFTVGKFGIGFNAVYHITDLPVIVSKDRMAFLDPQEKIWRGESGKYFELPDVQDMAATVAPFDFICNLSQHPLCSGTIFRFPLRTEASDLSKQCYDMNMVHGLLDSLKEEGKYLLLFLRSVDTIEVSEVDLLGKVTLKFRVSISSPERDNVSAQRNKFLRDIHQAYTCNGYYIQHCISLSISFHVELQNNEDTEKHHFLTVSQVGSDNEQVLKCAAGQHVLPWVGVGTELSSIAHFAGGRMFCFLPMPEDAVSPFPIHINGTFGMNDDRRTVKWQSRERKNDPAAQWNKYIVGYLLPPCYKKLIYEVINTYKVVHNDVYKLWPSVNTLVRSEWRDFIQPFLNLIFNDEVIWAESASKWIHIKVAILVPHDVLLPELIHSILSSCGVHIVKAPEKIHQALNHVNCSATCTYLTCSMARKLLRSNPISYKSLTCLNKLKLLDYCISDDKYEDLVGLQLLPLANNTFDYFCILDDSSNVQPIYLCNKDFPKLLFINMDHCLVNLSDPVMMEALNSVALSKKTQLQAMTHMTAVRLIKKSFPLHWKDKSSVVVQKSELFTQQWYKAFWQWIQFHALDDFIGNMVVPLTAKSPSGDLQVARLCTHSSIIYLRDNCSTELKLALNKLPVHTTSNELYQYLRHQELHLYVNKLSPDGLLNAIYYGCNGRCELLNKIKFTLEEANHLGLFLSNLATPYCSSHTEVLINLPIFTAANKQGLYTIKSVSQMSWGNSGILLHEGLDISIENIPNNLVIFTNVNEYYQLALLRNLSPHVKVQNSIVFVLDTICPMIQLKAFEPHTKINDIMVEVLSNLQSWKLKYSKETLKLIATLQNLQFVPILAGRHDNISRQCPFNLYDCSNPIIARIFQDECVFPVAPFNTKEILSQLTQCGLMNTVNVQKLIEVVRTISAAAKSGPQPTSCVKFNRAKAIIAYLGNLSAPDIALLMAETKSCCWFPVISEPKQLLVTDSYPVRLPWKGMHYKCHMVSANNSLFFPSMTTLEHCLIIGSQMYVIDCQLPSSLERVLNSSSYEIHVLAHLKEVIAQKDLIDAQSITRMVQLIYRYLNDHTTPAVVTSLNAFPPWIWLESQSKFVNTAAVAMCRNKTFSYDLAPFIYALPESFASQFQTLLSKCKVAATITPQQIATVLEMMHEGRVHELTPDNAWQMVMTILNWLTDSGNALLKDIGKAVLYLPVEGDSEYPQFADIGSEIVYSDNEFLEGFLAQSQQEYSYIVANHRIGRQMAICLGLTALSEHLDISEEMFEDVGQHEPLTVRLKNILTDYKDGLTIIKELIQNADDAGATEINICFDARCHTSDRKSLFFHDMAESHGPALVVHNDAIFTEEDFKNITKLAGGTKQNSSLKIGKFGIGFCSVYHITDVPSFVSQEYFYVFDPTLKYLKNAVKNPSRPGKRLVFTKAILKSSKQLDPFTKLFGFNPNKAYNGAIFRFPFRTSASEISSRIYDENTILEIIDSMKACSDELILFLNHIKRITFSHFFPSNAEPTILLDINKTTCSPKVVKADTNNVTVLKIFSGAPGILTCKDWLVATSSSQLEAKAAISSAACLLEQCDGIYKICVCKGEAFCFLPLGMRTGLPVHINANFAVTNNRRGIWTDEKAARPAPPEAQWNVHLMSTTIPEAYCLLLEELKKLQQNKKLNNYIFHTFWPVKNNLEQQNPWNICVATLFSMFTSKPLFYSDAVKMWLNLESCKFLPCTLLQITSSEDAIDPSVHIVIIELKLPVVDLPVQYRNQLELCKHIITEEKFLELFFEHISALGGVLEARNAILFKMFQVFSVSEQVIHRQKMIERFLRKYPCIPCTPDGKKLKECINVIDPSSIFALMYDDSESIFPTKNLFRDSLVKSAMYALGLHRDCIPWSFIVERASTIQTLYYHDTAKASDRIQCIIKSLHKNLISSDTSTTSSQSKVFASIPFLPIKPKPVDYPLLWYGEGQVLSCGKELVLPGEKDKYMKIYRNELLCGSQVNVLDTKWCTNSSFELDKVKDFLQIRAEPSCTEVLQQFKCLTSLHKKEIQNPLVGCICRSIYGYFEICLLSKDVTSVDSAKIQELKTFPSVFVNNEFVSCEVVAEEWSLTGPYLYRVPDTLITKKKLAFECMNIQKQFSIDTVKKALLQMKSDFGAHPVSNQCIPVIQHILVILETSVAENIDSIVVLPDRKFVLHEASKLVFNDTPWCPADKSLIFVHDCISRTTAEKHGVKTVRNERLELYCTKEENFGFDFGQGEELTQRIQNILNQYPLDVTILKELLQNADDAKATKLRIILDKRIHGGERLLSERWKKDLRGPAMFVWNDAVFSENDIKGIQKLGFGSKRSNTETIGMYGIGFNAVYNITDCPSFVSDGKTLCIFDPHCCYVHGANPQKPGRRFEISSGFWDDFEDMKPLYFRSSTENLPAHLQNELRNGTLFRFPLRNTPELVKQSKIVSKHKAGESKPVTADFLLRCLNNEWLPQIKQSLLFLNSVSDIQFYVIESDGKSKMLKHYETLLTDEGKIQRNKLFNGVHSFSAQHSVPLSVSYPLELSEEKITGQHKTTKEKWLIQQGVGDIDNEDQTWAYVSQIKPRHGIAIPMTVTSEFVSQVFCFLPLPITSHLPALINGSFILSDDRRNLWKSTNPNSTDPRSSWNDNLIDAISSSYANCLANSLKECVLEGDGTARAHIAVSLDKYYKLFPDVMAEAVEGLWLKLAQNVYIKLWEQNASVLAVIKPKAIIECSESDSVSTLWCRLQFPVKCFEKPYFFYADDRNHSKCAVSKQNTNKVPSSVMDTAKTELKEIFDILGMTITCAPLRMIDYFQKATGVHLPKTTACNVFRHYAAFNTQVLLTGNTFPCKIEDTRFRCIDTLKLFLYYILNDCDEGHCFIESPCGLPVLLTADRMVAIFDDQNKICCSMFSHLFPKSLHKFLHPEIINLSITKALFVGLDSHDVVDAIMSQSLPCKLLAVHVDNGDSIIAANGLEHLWQCFTSDPVFMHSLNYICKKWAVLPSNQNQLFSSKSDYLPVFISDASKKEQFEGISAVLHSIGMPFLDNGVSSLYSIADLHCCPDVLVPEQVLAHLYNFQNIFASSFSNIKPNQIKTLLEYISKINYKADEKSREHLMSLPIFQTIRGDYIAIKSKETYIYPHNINVSGLEKWIKQVNVVFLDRCGAWKTYLYGSESDLGIKNISPEDVYVRYIFTHFFMLTEEERYIHLKHIRDSLFKECKLHVDSPGDRDAELVESSHAFCNSLRTLQCLGADSTVLKVISEYCDHTRNIFMEFPEHFTFLPSYFNGDVIERKCWLEFFQLNGLKVSITKKQFYQFCEKVAEGKSRDVKASSVTLLEYLFSQPVIEEWSKDAQFLSKVSKIPFVCAQPVPSLAWIQTVCPCSKQIKTATETIAMTQLFGAYSDDKYVDISSLVWTVRPLVNLADYSGYAKLVKQHLGIQCSIDRKDVIDNVILISKSNLSDASHFHRSSEKCKPPTYASKSLIEVMHQTFKYFLSTPPGKAANILGSIPCIPVHRRFSELQNDKDIFILVRPSQVVANEHAKPFYPYLHALPDRLYDCLSFLDTIGVKRDMELCHMRLFLEMAFESSHDLPLHPNTLQLVTKAICIIYSKLKEHKGFLQSYDLKPLYLINHEKRLMESTALVYFDDVQYQGEHFDLTGSGLSLMYTLQNRSEEIGIDVQEFCNLLPSNVKPIYLSSCSHKKISFDKCELESPDVKRFRGIVQAQEVLEALKCILSHLTKDDALTCHYCDEYINLSSHVEVVAVDNLSYDVMLTSPARKIGAVRTRYALDERDTGCTLYIDYTGMQCLSQALICEISKGLSQWLIKHLKIVAKGSTKIDYLKVQKFLSKIFKMNDISSIPHLLQRKFNIKYNVQVEFDKTQPRHGQTIPESFHHRLDQDMHNLFIFEEWVGYELDNGLIVFAQVIRRVLQDPEDNGTYRAKYVIQMTEDNSNDVTVGALKLFKLLQSSSHPVVVESSELQDLAVQEDHSTPQNAATTSSSVLKILQNLCIELKEIWTLSEKDKKIAIRRLYLKWHPDKNPHQVKLSEEVFKFLTRQLDRLSAGLALEDPVSNATESGPRSTYSEYWRSNFAHWNETAENHHSSWQSEQARNREEPHSNAPKWQPTPSKAEGEQWIKQAEYDYQVLELLNCHNTTLPCVCSHVCFIAFEVVTKALKGGLLLKCGLNSQHRKQHNIVWLAETLEAHVPPLAHRLSTSAAIVKGYEECTRFPSHCKSNVAPGSYFGVQHASEAKAAASAVLAAVKEILCND